MAAGRITRSTGNGFTIQKNERMRTVGFLLVVFCLIAPGGLRLLGNDFIGYEKTYKKVATGRSALGNDARQLIAIARKEIGVVEGTVENDGERIREYLACSNIKSPAPWCAAWVSWCHAQAGFAQPRTAWSPSLFPAGKTIKEPLPGCVFGIYFPALKRVAHCGIVIQLRGDNVYTTEGNTSVNGSRNGDGVYARVRHKRSICKYADWFK